MKNVQPFQFSLLTLLLIVTLVAVECSVWKMSPPLGGVIAAASCVGLVGLISRSLVAARRGVRLTGEEKLLAFCYPIWLVGVIAIFATLFAFLWFIMILLF